LLGICTYGDGIGNAVRLGVTVGAVVADGGMVAVGAGMVFVGTGVSVYGRAVSVNGSVG